MSIRTFLFSTFLLIIVTFFHPVLGQTKNDSTALGISPAIIEKVLDRNEPVEGQIEIFNLTNVALPIKSLVTSFSPNEVVDIPEEKRQIYDASSWIKIKDPDFILQAKAHKTVEYSIKAPRQAAPGGHYATIFFQPLVPEQALSPQSLYILGRVGTLVFLVVPGDIKKQAKITKLEVPPFSQFGPVPIVLSVQNTGNIALRLRGKIEVLGTNDKIVLAKPLDEGLIIPGTTKNYEYQFGSYKTIGKFKAKATVIIDSSSTSKEERLVAESPSFWIFPYLPIGVLTVLTLTILIGTIRLRKRIASAINILLNKEPEPIIRRRIRRRTHYKKNEPIIIKRLKTQNRLDK